jgi:hypothetical protein
MPPPEPDPAVVVSSFALAVETPNGGSAELMYWPELAKWTAWGLRQCDGRMKRFAEHA